MDGNKIITSGKVWFTGESFNNLRKFQTKFERYWMLYYKKEHDIVRQNRKKLKPEEAYYAYIIVGRKTRRLAFVTPDGKRAYKIGDIRLRTSGQISLDRTTEQWSKFTLDRWCTSMDL